MNIFIIISILLLLATFGVIKGPKFIYIISASIWRAHVDGTKHHYIPIEKLIADSDKLAMDSGVSIKRNISYTGDKTRFHTMNVISPDFSKRLPAIIHIHGGGWSAGKKEDYDNFCTRISAEGFIVFSIDYSLAPDFNIYNQINDVFVAINFIINNYEFDKLVISGDSAGGHLAALATALNLNPEAREAYDLNYTIPFEISALFLTCPALSPRGNIITRCLTAPTLAGEWRKFRKHLKVSDCIIDKYPPTVIISSKADKLTYGMINKFCKSLEKKGLSVFRITEQHEKHNFNVKAKITKSGAAANKKAVEFIKGKV